MRHMLTSVSGILLSSVAAATVIPPAEAARPLSDLTLAPSWETQSQQSPPQDQVSPPQLDESDLQDSSLLPSVPLPHRDSGRGIDSSSVFDNHTAVEYRTNLGLGLGVATNASWCLSQSFPLAEGLHLSIYYLRGIGAFTPPLDRSSAAEIDSTGARAFGMSLQWKF